MNYEEATYKEKQAFEKTLTIAQRAKLRRLEKEFAEQILPINRASHAREEQVRKEAWKSLKVSERIQELENSYSQKLFDLREQYKKIQEELNATLAEQSEKRSQISTEPYHAVNDDPEVKAINAIWHNTRTAQKEKFQKLVDSFAVKVEA